MKRIVPYVRVSTQALVDAGVAAGVTILAVLLLAAAAAHLLTPVLAPRVLAASVSNVLPSSPQARLKPEARSKPQARREQRAPPVPQVRPLPRAQRVPPHGRAAAVPARSLFGRPGNVAGPFATRERRASQAARPFRSAASRAAGSLRVAGIFHTMPAVLFPFGRASLPAPRVEAAVRATPRRSTSSGRPRAATHRASQSVASKARIEPFALFAHASRIAYVSKLTHVAPVTRIAHVVQLAHVGHEDHVGHIGVMPTTANSRSVRRYRRAVPTSYEKRVALPEPPLGYDRRLDFVSAPAAPAQREGTNGLRIRGRVFFSAAAVLPGPQPAVSPTH